ncbi:MAG: glycosyl hydrolase family 18 protein [Gemmatimonadota bacterium]
MLAALCAAPGCAPSLRQVRVIGYMPAWKDLRSTVERTDLTRLTHINVAFLNPDSSGALTAENGPVCMGGATDADLRYLVEKAHGARVRVLASLGGGVIPRCSGDWESLLQPAARQRLVDNLVAFAAAYDLDGIDVDLEGVLLTAIDRAGNYTPFVQALAAALRPAGKLLTCATASYGGGMVPVESIPFFDFVNVMSYDAIGPSWGVAGSEHSTYEQALAHLDTWRARGLMPDKLVLGVPFYGYGFGGQYRRGYSYREILDTFGAAAASADLVGTACAGCSYVTYNGRETIRRKTRLALERGSGVMIWEMSQDAPAPGDLLGVIHEEIARSSR